MGKAFWEGFCEGFCEGFLRTNKYVIPISIVLAAGLALGSHFYSYEQCKRMYGTPEDIIEMEDEDE